MKYAGRAQLFHPPPLPLHPLAILRAKCFLPLIMNWKRFQMTTATISILFAFCRDSSRVWAQLKQAPLCTAPDWAWVRSVRACPFKKDCPGILSTHLWIVFFYRATTRLGKTRVKLVPFWRPAVVALVSAHVRHRPTTIRPFDSGLF